MFKRTQINQNICCDTTLTRPFNSKEKDENKCSFCHILQKHHTIGVEKFIAHMAAYIVHGAGVKCAEKALYKI